MKVCELCGANRAEVRVIVDLHAQVRPKGVEPTYAEVETVDCCEWCAPRAMEMAKRDYRTLREQWTTVA
jgi:hypothetical protein